MNDNNNLAALNEEEDDDDLMDESRTNLNEESKTEEENPRTNQPQPSHYPSLNQQQQQYYHEAQEEEVYSDDDDDDEYNNEEYEAGTQVNFQQQYYKQRREIKEKKTSETNTEGEYVIHPRPANFNTAPKPAYQIQLEIYYGEEFPNKTVIVNVYNESLQKPFLGGFKNTVNNLLFHHASTQTDSQNQKQRNVQLYHRETQTKKFSSQAQQTLREQGTQMEKPGLTIDTSGDRVIQASTYYFDYEMLRKLQIEMAVKIQRNVRRWIAKRRADKIRQEREEEFQETIYRAQQMDDLQSSKKQKEIKRRMHPRKAQDFSIMYEELEAWRIKETEDINSTTKAGTIERKHAMKELLRKQTKLLQTIDRLKIVANQQNKQENIQKDLEKMAQPKKVEYANTTRVNYNRARDLKEGSSQLHEPHEDSTTVTEVETPFTVRAKELRDLYYGLNTEMLSVDERLDVLLHVKWTVKEFEQDSIVLDIIELIDREADLLNRGRKDNSLTGLRTRLSNLFLQFIKNPKYNPEAIMIENRKKNKMRDLIDGISSGLGNQGTKSQ